MNKMTRIGIDLLVNYDTGDLLESKCILEGTNVTIKAALAILMRDVVAAVVKQFRDNPNEFPEEITEEEIIRHEKFIISDVLERMVTTETVSASLDEHSGTNEIITGETENNKWDKYM